MGSVTIYTCDRCDKVIENGIRDAERVTFGFSKLGSQLDYKERWLVCLDCQKKFLEFMKGK